MPTIYITAPGDAAETIARTLVEERLAACVNLLPCNSVYRWNGAIHTDAESVLLAKTTEDRYTDLKDRVEELHPYEVPCLERFDENDVLRKYEDWRTDSVGRD